MFNGLVSLTGEPADQRPVRILRDTGASQSVILASTLPFSKESACGYGTDLRGIEMGRMRQPVHRVHLRSELVTGFFPVAVCNELPVRGIAFLMGNDVAGARVTPAPEELNTPQRTENTRLGGAGTGVGSVSDAESPQGADTEKVPLPVAGRRVAQIITRMLGITIRCLFICGFVINLFWLYKSREGFDSLEPCLSPVPDFTALFLARTSPMLDRMSFVKCDLIRNSIQISHPLSFLITLFVLVLPISEG